MVEGDDEVYLQRLSDTVGLTAWVVQLQQGLPFMTIGQDYIAFAEFYNKAARNM